MSTDVRLPGPRQAAIMQAALTVFARFGYRKTSMDEIAQAAGLSRQSLYTHFGSKQKLFRAMVEFMLSHHSAQAVEALADADESLEQRLVGGFDAWYGWYVDSMHGEGVDELIEQAQALQPLVEEHEARFHRALKKTIRASGLVAAHKELSAGDLAESLEATARGLKYLAANRADFVRRVAVAVRIMCAPLTS